MSAATLHRRFRQLIGERFDYVGETWVLIEVLADSDCVVLRRCADCPPGGVQKNAYGIPNRRAEDMLTLPISDSSGQNYSQDIMILLEGRRGRAGAR
jgi:hypothetical protein